MNNYFLKLKFAKENLLLLGLATEDSPVSMRDETLAPKGSTSGGSAIDERGSDTSLWETDVGYEYDMTAITNSGYKAIIKTTKNGIKGYALIKKNDEQRFMTFDKLKLLKFVLKK